MLDFDQFPTYDNPPAQLRVRGILCGDEKGKMQIIAPESALIDPRPIQQSTARKVTSLPQEADTSICAIPGFYGLPSVVDDALKQQTELALATEQPGRYVRATGTELQQLCLSHASFEAQFCNHLTYTPMDRSDDEHRVLEAVETFTTRRIQARLDETLHIPPLPEAARRIINLQHDPRHDLKDLVRIIETDPAIAAKIINWANSAMYSRGAPSKTLSDAIMRVLGFDLVFNMALGMAIGATLSLPKDQVRGACPFWVESVYSAATMEALTHQIAPAERPDPGISYLAGLLSNFGTLVIGHVFTPQYQTICRLTEANPHQPQAVIDEHILHLSREVIAATLLELWDLPAEVITAVRYQQLDEYCGDHAIYAGLLNLTRKLLDQPLTPQQELAVNDSVAEQAEHMGISTADLTKVATTVSESQADFWGMAQGMGKTGAA